MMPLPSLATFDPVHALVGGLFIGIASVARMAISGRITGLTSVPAGILRGKANEPERYLFIAGLIGSGFLLHSVSPQDFVQAELAPWREILGGLLAGFGGALVSARCPSGHGIRGQNALSLCSMTYTTAVLLWTCVVACVTHAANAVHSKQAAAMMPRDAFIAMAIQLLVGHLAAYACLLGSVRANVLPQEQARDLQSAIDGSLVGCGIGLSGAMSPARVVGFFDITTGLWDPSLGLIMLAAALITTSAMKIETLHKKVADPVLTDKPVEVPSKKPQKWRHVAGGLLFFTSAGVAGLFPGPAMVSLPYSPHALYLGAVIAGVLLADTAFPELKDTDTCAKPVEGAASSSSAKPVR